MINPAPRNNRSLWTDGELDVPEQWLTRPEHEVPDSWCRNWSDWLRSYAGEKIPVIATLGNSELSPIEPEPAYLMPQRLTLPGTPILDLPQLGISLRL